MLHRQGRGLCASDVEQRIHLSSPPFHITWRSSRGRAWWKRRNWPVRWYQRNETALREFVRALKKSL